MSSNIQQALISTTIDVDDHTRFSSINSSSLNRLVTLKDQSKLRAHGGIEGIASALETDMLNGIYGDENDIESRIKAFGSNMSPDYDFKKCFYLLVLKAAKDPMIILLLFCSLVSLGFGIKRHGLKQELLQQGGINFIAILAVIIVVASSDFWIITQSLNLSYISSYNIPQVDVVRHGVWQQMSTEGLVVGDVIFLKPGDQVPADGLFIDGNALRVETVGGARINCTEIDVQQNPFMIFGGMVVHGYARMLVTSVGANKHQHVISLRGTLVNDFEKLSSLVGKIGKGVAFLSFLVLTVRYFAGSPGSAPEYCFAGNIRRNNTNCLNFLDMLANLVSIAANPAMIALTSSLEDLLLSIKFGIGYSIRRLMARKILLRRVSLCHSTASITTICLNKTATLTRDSMKVNKFWLGLSSIENIPYSLIAPNVLELLHQGIGLNTIQVCTRSSLESPSNLTEKAVLDWCMKNLGLDIGTLQQNCTILEVDPFNPRSKASRVLISNNADHTIHVHQKGSPEVVLPLCSHFYETTGIVQVLSTTSRAILEQILKDMARNGLRCIAFAHRKTSIRDYFNVSNQKLILLGLVGLENPCLGFAKSTIQDCHQAKINVKLVTGDNILTAISMAIKSSILRTDYQLDEVMQGEEFQKFSPEERLERVENIKVLARATPSDKYLFVQSLKQKGHVVAYVGRGIGDVRALKEAKIGLCLGTKSAEMAKACADIVTRDNDFPKIIDILKSGRGIYKGIERYSEFLLIATLVALVVDFIRTVSARELTKTNAVPLVSDGKIPYPVFELLWVKLIMGPLAIFALIVKPASKELMYKPPRDRKAPPLNKAMLPKICIQALYQIALLLTIHFKGEALLNVSCDEKDTLVLNTYILCQVCCMFTAQFGGKEVLRKIHRRKLFWGVVGLIMVFQVIIVQVLHNIAGTTKLSYRLWITCVSIAATTFPIGWLVRNTIALKKLNLSNLMWPSLKLKLE